MSVPALVLIIITVISLLIIIFVAPFVRKITNSYIFWAALGILCLTYLITCRFAQGWKDYSLSGNDQGIITSRAFLLDICPFCVFSMCLSIIFDPTRKMASTIAPFSLFGGLITIIGGGDQTNPTLNFKYIFIGDSLNPMYFMMHYLGIVISTLVLLNVPRLTFKNWIYCNVFAMLYYFYVAMFMATKHVSQNVSGLNNYDWEYGEYSSVALVLNCSPTTAAGLGFFISYVAISLLMWLQNCLNHFKWYKYPNKFNSRFYLHAYACVEKNTQIMTLRKFWEYPFYFISRICVCFFMFGIIFTSIGIGIYNHTRAISGIVFLIIGLIIVVISITSITVSYRLLGRDRITN